MLKYSLITILCFISLIALARTTSIDSLYKISYPEIILQGIECEFNIEVGSKIQDDITIPDSININGKLLAIQKTETVNSFSFVPEESTIELKINDSHFTFENKAIPLWLSILPPIIAIIIALVFREVFTALFLGILSGTFIIHFYSGEAFLSSIFLGILSIIDTYVISALLDSGHLSIIVFSMMIGAMVNLISKNGGMMGIVNYLSRKADNARSGQLITWLLGIAIFFDDYANTLVVGNTMRPIADKLKFSREKLAYIVDSTAAPIASIAFVTTWIGAELSYIENGINVIGLEMGAYNVFFNSLAYSFYPIFALIFVVMLIWSKRDYGPMLKVEKNIQIQKAIIPDESNIEVKNPILKERWWNAAIPVLVIIFGTFTGLLYTGWNSEIWESGVSFSSKLSETIGNSDSYKALLWSSMFGVLVTVFLTVSQKLLNLKESVEALLGGFKTILTAILILTLAWALALITEHLHTADFLSGFLTNMSVSVYFIPAITFVLASLVAFSTGTSWGTMAILYPLLLPSTWAIAEVSGIDHQVSLSIFFNVVSCVLAGSVLGDHCSPISDTTILSSLASGCNHVSHVRTQLPYALTVGGISLFLGTVPASFGISPWILFLLGIFILYFIIRLTGRKSIM